MRCESEKRTMSQQYIREYFKPRGNLPDPSGALSSSLAFAAIASVNWEVEKEVYTSS